jgi:bis(5'-nucleosidyl)-tetraphosphatase
MPFEKSAGAVIFRKKGRTVYYLLLHYPSGVKAEKEYWDLPKGHIEKGEKEIDTVRREVEEETGLRNLQFVEGFKEWIKYFFNFQGEKIFKIVTFYLARVETEEVRISSEHIGFKWLSFEEAGDQLTFKNAKGILKKADDFLSGKSLSGGKKNKKR